MKPRIVPNNIAYKKVEQLNKYAEFILYLSTFLSISISSLGYFKLFPDLKTFLIGINISSICIYAFLDNRANYIFTRAEMRRRLDWLDNSFGTNFSGKKSQGYFTNEELHTGLYKLTVNCFENSHHTQFVISKMLTRIIIQTVIIILVFISSAYVGDREIIRLFFELALPAILLQKLIKVIFFSSRMTEVHDRFRALFNDLMRFKFEDKTPDALRDILEYESTLSWASTPLSSRIFKKYQVTLADEWDELKREYHIMTT